MIEDQDKLESEFLQKCRTTFEALTPQQQLEVFCAVVNKLTVAELDNHASYRGVLYTEFGFDEQAYGAAQIAGFVRLHNSIFNKQEAEMLLDMAHTPVKTLIDTLAKHSDLSPANSVAEVIVKSKF